MDIYSKMFSKAFILNEQIARQIFETIPEQGPVVVIIDSDGNSWPSDSEEYHKLNIHESFLKDLCRKIDDGVEPVITQENQCSFVASQLSTDKNNCGYIILALTQYTNESILENINLIEMLLNQFSLIAKLIEKNNHFCEMHTKRPVSKNYDNISLN